jgi:hypothetical protein
MADGKTKVSKLSGSKYSPGFNLLLTSSSLTVVSIIELKTQNSCALSFTVQYFTFKRCFVDQSFESTSIKMLAILYLCKKIILSSV